MNIFARTLGGVFGDRFGQRWGLSGRVKWLFIAMFCEGLALMLFSQMQHALAGRPGLDPVQSVRADVGRGHVRRGAVRQPKALGSVAGIVGAGGNAGAVAAGFLFKSASVPGRPRC